VWAKLAKQDQQAKLVLQALPAKRDQPVKQVLLAKRDQPVKQDQLE
jgi:hypothetical protein